MFALHVAMWTGMMAAMMAPVAWPWVITFRGLLVPDSGVSARRHATIAFVSGYFSAWLAYAAVAAALQGALASAGLLDESGRVPGSAGAAILIGAGVFQLTPLKRACLTHCRNPLSFLLTRWRDGPPSAFRIGAAHGAYCVGCCWAVMATMLAVGLANLWWMAALTLTVFIEQAVPRGDRLRVPIGLALLLVGLRQIG
jgi:predicted metal-binding membrane protein